MTSVIRSRALADPRSCRVHRYRVPDSRGLVRGCSVKAESELCTRSPLSAPRPHAMLQLLALSAALGIAVAAPATYDQRQEGEFNVRADLQNVVLLIALPKKMPSSDFLDLFTKNVKHDHVLQDRADIHIMDAFVEPSTPYRVEIGERSEGDGRAAEVVIGRRRSNVESEEDRDYKLVGAMEQCGPDMERDPVTLACRKLPEPPQPPQPSQPDEPATAVQPEVVPAA